MAITASIYTSIPACRYGWQYQGPKHNFRETEKFIFSRQQQFYQKTKVYQPLESSRLNTKCKFYSLIVRHPHVVADNIFPIHLNSAPCTFKYYFHSLIVCHPGTIIRGEPEQAPNVQESGSGVYLFVRDLNVHALKAHDQEKIVNTLVETCYIQATLGDLIAGK